MQVKNMKNTYKNGHYLDNRKRREERNHVTNVARKIATRNVDVRHRVNDDDERHERCENGHQS